MAPELIVHHLQHGQGERIPFLLEELNIPYELELYQRDPFLSPESLKKLHPMGASPVLEDRTDNPSNPLLLAESGAITEYIINKYGNGNLTLKPDNPRYADYVYWLHFSNGNLQPTFLRRMMTRRAVNNNESHPSLQDATRRINVAVGHIESHLSKNKYFAGDEFTAADIMTLWCFTTMRCFEPLSLKEYPGIHAWVKRVTEREGYRKAIGRSDPQLDIEGLSSVEGPELFGPLKKMKEQLAAQAAGASSSGSG